MKTHYGLPSGDYTISLTKEELNQLVSKGSITMRASRTPCTASRAVINESGDGLNFHDKKEVWNDLRFHLDEPVADISAGEHNIQFLNICIDKDDARYKNN